MKTKKMDLENTAFLRKAELDALLDISVNGFVSQHKLADRIGVSLGKANSVVKVLQNAGMLSADNRITEEANRLITASSPKRAVILAAGNGLRMAPFNNRPKGLLLIHGEPLIERLVRQLGEAGVSEIYLIVGFMKEQYAYLENRYGIKLIYNAAFAKKNTLHSLSLAAGKLDNCYIAPSDYYCVDNPFSRRELYSWYMLSKEASVDGEAKLNRKCEVEAAADDAEGLPMVGIAYLQGNASTAVARALETYSKIKRFNQSFWEIVLLQRDSVRLYGKTVDLERYVEINTFEDLRSLDYDERQLDSKAIDAIKKSLGVGIDDISDVKQLKGGMTNRSFLFTVGREKYIVRIPGAGSSQLVNRQGEYETYRTVNGCQISDDVVFISPDDGYKIAHFWEDARVCDPLSAGDVAACMKFLRKFHKMKLSVPQSLDVFMQILHYENFLKGTPSVFADYKDTKKKVLSLKEFVDRQPRETTLTHIDAVPDNFLFVDGQIRLIDWEYAAMCDPHVDIAMFAVYAMYEPNQVDALIDSYFTDGCPDKIRTKIYCYVAACGLLWSNWCEFKRLSGVEFGEYSLRQYLFAKEYYRIAADRIKKLEMEQNESD